MNKIALITSLFVFVAYGCGNKTKTTNHSIEGKHKNKKVLFILVDDMGWTDLGCYGSTFYETPNIDKLAASSALFTSAYTPNPVCSPTRASILTGKYPTRIGITDWIPGQNPKNKKLLGPKILDYLPLEEITIAEKLKESGYKTFFSGKWHLGDTGFLPENQGFDINKGGFHEGHPPNGYYSPYKNPKLSDGPEGEYLTDRLTDESIKFIKEKTQENFFLFLSYYTVHTPIQANKKHIKKFQDKQSDLAYGTVKTVNERNSKTVINQYNPEYASMVYALDKNIGRLMDTLEELDIMNETLIIFTSDNGGLTTLKPNRTAPTSVKPLRAGKGWVYEGGVRVPLIIKEAKNTESKKISAPVSSMDLFPTILDELDLPLRPDLHKDGVSLKPLLQGNSKTAHDILFWDYPHYHGSGWTPGQALRKGDWKLIYFYEDDIYELYNIKNDISESNNLAKVNSKKLEELKLDLKKINTELKTKTPTVNVR